MKMLALVCLGVITTSISACSYKDPASETASRPAAVRAHTASSVASLRPDRVTYVKLTTADRAAQGNVACEVGTGDAVRIKGYVTFERGHAKALIEGIDRRASTAAPCRLVGRHAYLFAGHFPGVAAYESPEVGIHSSSSAAEALAADVSGRTRGFDGKTCTSTAYSVGNSNNWLGNCWSCVGGAITDSVGWPSIGGDATPNSFVTVLRDRFNGGRPLNDGIITMGGRRWRVTTNRFKSDPGRAPRGSLLLCNTGSAGHSTVIIQSGSRARSDVWEAPATAACHSGNIREILHPL